jgi:hypothetical protein
MTSKTITPAPASVAADLLAELGGFAPSAPVKPAKPATAADYRRAVDLAIIIAAGDLVNDMVPEQFRSAVAAQISNQLHHLSTPKAGWPSAVLPVPDRSDWR